MVVCIEQILFLRGVEFLIRGSPAAGRRQHCSRSLCFWRPACGEEVPRVAEGAGESESFLLSFSDCGALRPGQAELKPAAGDEAMQRGACVLAGQDDSPQAGGQEVLREADGAGEACALSLSDCGGLGALLRRLEGGRHLRWSINLDGYAANTDAAVRAIAMCCPRLQSLSLVCCKDVTDTSLRVLAEGCPDLRSIDISVCNRVTDDGVISLARRCPGLERVDLTRCPRVSDDAVEALSQNCRHIHTLSLATAKITDAGAEAIARNLRGLKALDLTGCCQVSPSSVALLWRQCPELQSLELGEMWNKGALA
mmetsp:Transcript_121378/g.369071  ORF Transcript_121378/g.369071 Transcript_121378/m.369071 type:complete len:311 (+) Transcript_121378:63-995(+)